MYFAQSDGSLTVLDINTGSVLERKSNIDYGGTLQLVDEGIFVRTYGKLAVLNKSTLEVIWQAEKEYDPVIEGHRLVSYDGNGLVECRAMETGKILWSYNLPGALDIVVLKGKVLIFRDARYDGAEEKPSVVLLDLETGQELLCRNSPPLVHYFKAYFDGDRIYLETGPYKDGYRTSARFENLIVWDLEGREIESIPVPADINKENLADDEAFTLKGKVFARGRVWKSIEDIPPWRDGRAQSRSSQDTEDGKKEITVARFDLADGNVTISTTGDHGSRYNSSAERKVAIELKSSTDNWKGSLPYLKPPGDVVVLSATDQKIILGTNLGHIEAINRQDGQSDWMYIFPTMRHTMSYSGGCMPPMLATAAAIYKRENQKKEPESGLMLDGSDEPSKPKIVFDPEPARPFEKLPLYLAIAWAGVLLPLTFTGSVLRLSRKRNWGIHVPALNSLVMAASATVVLFFYGRVSVPTALGLRAAMGVPLIIAIFLSMRALREKRWISGAIILLLAIALGVFIFPAFLRL